MSTPDQANLRCAVCRYPHDRANPPAVCPECGARFENRRVCLSLPLTRNPWVVALLTVVLLANLAVVAAAYVRAEALLVDEAVVQHNDQLRAERETYTRGMMAWATWLRPGVTQPATEPPYPTFNWPRITRPLASQVWIRSAAQGSAAVATAGFLAAVAAMTIGLAVRSSAVGPRMNTTLRMLAAASVGAFITAAALFWS